MAFTGTIMERLRCIAPIMNDLTDMSILDLNVEDGLVLYSLALAGIRSIHAFCPDKEEYNFAKKLLRKAGIEYWLVNEEFTNKPLDRHYDVIFYLDIHGHLMDRYGEIATLSIVMDLLDICDHYFVLRDGAAHDGKYFDDVNSHVIHSGNFRMVNFQDQFINIPATYIFKRW